MLLVVKAKKSINKSKNKKLKQKKKFVSDNFAAKYNQNYKN